MFTSPFTTVHLFALPSEHKSRTLSTFTPPWEPMTVKDVAVWGPPCYALATELSIALVRPEGERTPAVRPTARCFCSGERPLKRSAGHRTDWYLPFEDPIGSTDHFRVDRRVKEQLESLGSTRQSICSSSIGPKKKQFEGPEMVQKNGP